MAQVKRENTKETTFYDYYIKLYIASLLAGNTGETDYGGVSGATGLGRAGKAELVCIARYDDINVVSCGVIHNRS